MTKSFETTDSVGSSQGKPEPTRISVGAVGDVAFLGALQDAPALAAISALTPLLSSVDLFIANLETVLTNQPNGPHSKLRLRSSPGWAPILKEAGIRLVSLANNHAMDFEAEGLSSTIRCLEAEDIHYVGAGANRDAARQPYRTTVHGQSVAVLARSAVEVRARCFATATGPGVAKFEPEADLAQIRALKAEGIDHVLFVPHWGLERYRYPSSTQRQWAKELLQAGASAVIGHHPHVVQAFEEQHNRAIIYSLGNCVFGEFDWKYQAHDGSAQSDEYYRLSAAERQGMFVEVALDGDQSRIVRTTRTTIATSGELQSDQKAVTHGWLNHPLRLPPAAFEALWLSYSGWMEFSLRLWPRFSQLIRKPAKLRPRHFKEAAMLLSRSARVSSQKTTNPYDG